MIMTPAILAPMRLIFSRQARTGTRQHRNRIDHKFRYERLKKKKIVRGVHGKTAWHVQLIYTAILGNFDRALTDVTWARVPQRSLRTGNRSFARDKSHHWYMKRIKTRDLRFFRVDLQV